MSILWIGGVAVLGHSTNTLPEEGVFAYLPAGDKFHAQISCNKHFTSWGNTNEAGYAELEYACDTSAMIHSGHDDFKSTELKDVKGCGIAIAYESDPNKVKPEDFVVISTDYQCPFLKAVDFAIPEGLPACPEGGCLCSFNWVHSGSGGRPEMVHNGFRCKVTGKTGDKPLAKPVVARKCPYDRNNCTVGAKTPFIWQQNEGSNVLQDERDPPFYNWEYGFAQGAQMDVWQTDDSPANPEPAPHHLETGKGHDPAETPATKSGVPPAIRTPMKVTPAPFSFKPGVTLAQDAEGAQPTGGAAAPAAGGGANDTPAVEQPANSTTPSAPVPTTPPASDPTSAPNSAPTSPSSSSSSSSTSPSASSSFTTPGASDAKAPAATATTTKAPKTKKCIQKRHMAQRKRRISHH